MSSERLTSAQYAVMRCLEQKNHSLRSNTDFALEMTIGICSESGLSVLAGAPCAV